MLSGMTSETFRSHISIAAVLAALALGGVATHGQRTQGGGAGTPLLIDFTAATADGKAVTELAPADVTIKIGGKARTITGLELKKVSPAAAAPAAAAAGAPAAAPTDITPPFTTNEASAAPAPAPAANASVSRAVLIIIDTDSLTPGGEGAMKTAVGALLDGLGPSDRVGLVTAPRDTAQVGFGTSLSRVKDALAAIKGQKPASVSTADTICRTTQTLGQTASLLGTLASNSTPTSVVFIAGSLSAAPAKDSGSSGTCEVVQGDYQRVADAAAESRVNMYVVQGESATMGRNDGLESLAGIMGAGTVMRVTGEGIAPRILADASTYWVATVAPDPSDKPGQAQRLEVKAVKDGVTVHARGSAAPSRAAMAAPAAAGGAAKPGAASPKDMVASQAAYTDLQLRAATIMQRGQGDKINVFVQVEPVDPAVKLTAVRVGYFDAANKGGALDVPKIGTYPVTQILPLAAGQYRVRVAATDSTGKGGAVDLNVNAGLTPAGTLKISGLMTGAPEGDKGMKPQLQYVSEPNVLVFLELYGQFTAQIGVKFEIAKSDAGPALDTYPPAGGGPTNEPDKLQVFGQVPIDKLAPGDYVIRAVVEVEGKAVGTAMKTIRKVAK